MKTKIPAFVALLLLAASAATPAEQKAPLQIAQAGAPGGQADGKETVNDKGLVCVEEEKTGTHFVRKVCRTPEQMKAERAAAQELMRKNQGVANMKQGGD